MQKRTQSSLDDHQDGLELADIRHAVGGVKQHAASADVAEQALDAHHMMVAQAAAQTAEPNHAGAHHGASTAHHVGGAHGDDHSHVAPADNFLSGAVLNVGNAVHNCEKAVNSLAATFGGAHFHHHATVGAQIAEHAAQGTHHHVRLDSSGIPATDSTGPGAVTAHAPAGISHSVGHSPFFGDPGHGPHHNPFGWHFGHGHFPGGNPGPFPGHFPGGHLPGGLFPGGHFPGGHFPGGHFPVGHFPGGHPTTTLPIHGPTPAAPANPFGPIISHGPATPVSPGGEHAGTAPAPHGFPFGHGPVAPFGGAPGESPGISGPFGSIPNPLPTSTGSLFHSHW